MVIRTAFALFLAGCALLCMAETGTEIQPRKLIDCHTAGSLPRGYVDLDLKFFNEGGIRTAVNVGLTNRLSIGIAYQAMHVIGTRDIIGQTYPGGLIKYRLMEESYYLPALALGFDSQGSGDFEKFGETAGRFYFKSKGAFVAISKSYLLLGYPLGLHFECNYSAVDNNQAESEKESDLHPSNKFMNMAVGIDKSINEELSLMAEYDAALDDNYSHNLLDGYLNIGVRWAIIETFIIELDLKDLLENKRAYPSPIDEYVYAEPGTSREVRVVYIKKF